MIAVESGVVVEVVPFTGPSAESPWWRDTQAVLVEGASGVVCYGEVDPLVSAGMGIVGGSRIGSIRQVLLDSRPRMGILGHLPSMLHLELYEAGTRQPVEWQLGATAPSSLVDPTPFLKASR